jgi:hypothetical protein
MTNIKKLFLTLSLLTVQSTFGMDAFSQLSHSTWQYVPQSPPIQSPDGKKGWVKVRTSDDFKPCIGKFFKCQYSKNDKIETLFSSPKEDLSWPYSVFAGRFAGQVGICVTGYSLEQGNGSAVRLLTFEELRELDTALKNKMFSPINHRNEVVLPNEGKDFFRASHLTPDERARYLKQPLRILLGLRRFRQSSLNILPKDVVTYMGQLTLADNPILKFE